MKRFFTLFTTVVVFLSAHAQVAFLKYTDASYNDEGGEHPELNAYNWFKDTLTADSKTMLSIQQVKDGALLLSAGVPAYKVLWINVDQVGLANLSDAGFDASVITAIGNYVKAGGNLLLTKQATRLAYDIHRIDYEPQWANGGYSTGVDTWSINPHLGYSVNHTDRSGHAIFHELETIDTYAYTTYPLVGANNRTDNNNNYEPMKRENGSTQGNEESDKLSNFESDWNCHVLATWGHVTDFCVPGIIEFFPKGDFKGTIMVNGFSAYQWGSSNTKLNNVKKLTKNCLDYLSLRALVTLPKAEPIIKDEEYIKAEEYCTISSGTTTEPLIANVSLIDKGEHDGEYQIFYNYFGGVTFNFVVTGDGVNVPKNEMTYSISRTVTGGEPAQYAYVLPYSLHTISQSNYDHDNDYGNIPDFLSALWFYEHYIKEDRTEEDNYGNGCFINPRNYSSSAAIPSEIHVLWVHNDNVEKVSDTYRDDLGCQTSPTYEFYFKDALQAFINRGGNVFLSKQATRLLGDLGRVGFPSYENGGYGTCDGDGCNWGIKNIFFDGTVDYSTHPVYTTPNNLGVNPRLIDVTNHAWRTNNNDILFRDNVNTTLDAFNAYQTANNCKLLGCWDNTGTHYQAGVFAEFLPQGTGQGTIIMLGASAYQWTCGENTALLSNVYENVPKITQNILQYLSTTTVVVTEPDTPIPSPVNDLVVYQGGSVSNDEDITIRNSITYIRPAVGGTAGNALGHWYTFCLPFEPSAVKVHDVSDDADYPINSVYLNGSEGETSGNPKGSGYFYLQTFSSFENGNTNWAYIGNEGIPYKDTPYIIKFIDDDEDKAKGNLDLDTYFTSNPVIKFIGGEQKISGNEDGTGGLATGDFSFHVNKTLRKLELTNIYPLNIATNMFEYDYGGTSTIMPFECYIKASTPALAAARPRIMIGRKATQYTNITTSIENPTAESHSPVFVYDLMGRRCYEGMPQTLPSGIWIVRQGEMSKTIVIP